MALIYNFAVESDSFFLLHFGVDVLLELFLRAQLLILLLESAVVLVQVAQLVFKFFHVLLFVLLHLLSHLRSYCIYLQID